MKTRFKFLFISMVVGAAMLASCTSRTTDTNMRGPGTDTTTIQDGTIRNRTDTTMNRGTNIETDTMMNRRSNTERDTMVNQGFPERDTMMNRGNNTWRDTTMNQNDNTSSDTPLNQSIGTVGSEAEVLMLVMTIDQNEINAAAAAREKEMSQAVTDYANMLHTEHSRNLEMGRSMAQTMTNADTTAQSEAVENLTAKGENTLTILTPLDGQEFERAFIAAMVKDHQDALSLIDNQLLPAAKSEALRNHLTQTRQKVAMHLERAKALQAERP